MQFFRLLKVYTHTCKIISLINILTSFINLHTVELTNLKKNVPCELSVSTAVYSHVITTVIRIQGILNTLQVAVGLLVVSFLPGSQQPESAFCHQSFAFSRLPLSVE